MTGEDRPKRDRPLSDDEWEVAKDYLHWSASPILKRMAEEGSDEADYLFWRLQELNSDDEEFAPDMDELRRILEAERVGEIDPTHQERLRKLGYLATGVVALAQLGAEYERLRDEPGATPNPHINTFHGQLESVEHDIQIQNDRVTYEAFLRVRDLVMHDAPGRI